MINTTYAQKVSLTVFLLCVFSIFSEADAQTTEQQSIKVGETEIIPEFRLDYVSVDNAFNNSESPVEASGVLLSPAVSWRADRRLLKITAAYNGTFGAYSESILDFNDHSLTFRIDAAPGVRHRTFGVFAVKKRHELLGTGQTTFITDATKQVVSTTARVNVGYTFGVTSAKGNVGGGLILGTQTFNDVGSITEGDDNSEVTPYAFFSYRLSPDTRFVTQLDFRLTDYDEDRRDRTEIKLLTGVEIAATDRSGGSVQIGISQADFSAAGVSDSTQVISDINLYFKPRSYSRLDFVFTRNFITLDEDESGSGASLVNVGRLSWNHEWTSRISTVASFRSSRTERNCPNNDSSTRSAGLEVNVKIRRWFSVGAGINSVSRSAVLCDKSVPPDEFDTDRSTFGLHLTGSL